MNDKKEYSQVESKITYYHIATFLVCLPFDRFYSELALISFLVHSTIHINKRKLRNIFTAKTLLAGSVFFITALGLLYSRDNTEGVSDLQKQLAIILFPALFACYENDFKKYRAKLLLLFALVCAGTNLYLFFDALRIIYYNKLPFSVLFTEAFLNHNFSAPIGIHATYMAMYSLLSVVILFYSIFNTEDKKLKIAFFIAILILLAGLLQLASRAVLLSAIFIVLSFPFLLLKKRNRIKFIVETTGVIILAGLLITNISTFKERYVSKFKEDLTAESLNNEIPEPRITRWQYILQTARKSPVYGYGTGSEKRMLIQTYFDNKLYRSYLHELNSHNQYLAIFVETGIWGLVIFLLSLAAGLIMAIRQKDILFLGFLIIVCVVSFSENILDVNKGIFFYSFFFSLFVFSGKPFPPLFRFKRSKDQLALK